MDPPNLHPGKVRDFPPHTCPTKGACPGPGATAKRNTHKLRRRRTMQRDRYRSPPGRGVCIWAVQGSLGRGPVGRDEDAPTSMDVVVTGRVLRGGYDRSRSAVLLVDGINTPRAPVWVGVRLAPSKGWVPLPARPRFAWLTGTLNPYRWKSI